METCESCGGALVVGEEALCDGCRDERRHDTEVQPESWRDGIEAHCEN